MIMASHLGAQYGIELGADEDMINELEAKIQKDQDSRMVRTFAEYLDMDALDAHIFSNKVHVDIIDNEGALQALVEVAGEDHIQTILIGDVAI
jgi:hypothetical protein